MSARRTAVELEILSRMDSEGDLTETRLFVPGELTWLESGCMLRYRDPEGNCDTVLRVSENGQALIRRTGEFSGRIPVVPGEQAVFLYRTPYGDLELVSEGLELVLEEGDRAGEIRLRYRVVLPQGGTVSENHIIIRYKESAN